MKAIFEQGSLSRYSQVRLDESMSPVIEHSQYGAKKTTVFISHKHDDLDDLKGLRETFRHQYGSVDVHAVDGVKLIGIDNELRVFRKGRFFVHVL